MVEELVYHHYSCYAGDCCRADVSSQNASNDPMMRSWVEPGWNYRTRSAPCPDLQVYYAQELHHTAEYPKLKLALDS
jgi:hypothetical protein